MTDLPTDPIDRRMELQSREFSAMNKLCESWKTLQHVAIVDDEYPYYRGHYELDLRLFLKAVGENRATDLSLHGIFRTEPSK